MSDMTMRFWEVGEVCTRDIRAVVADPGLEALPAGPAKDLLTTLAVAVNPSYVSDLPDDATLTLLAATDNPKGAT